MHGRWRMAVKFNELNGFSKLLRTFAQHIEISQYPESAGKRGVGEQDGKVWSDAGGFAAGINDVRQSSGHSVNRMKKAACRGGLQGVPSCVQSSDRNST